VLECRLVRSIAINTNVAVSASALDRNKGTIERNTALLLISEGALTRNCVLSERRHATMLE
jgi:hypothetical protein